MITNIDPNTRLQNIGFSTISATRVPGQQYPKNYFIGLKPGESIIGYHATTSEMNAYSLTSSVKERLWFRKDDCVGSYGPFIVAIIALPGKKKAVESMIRQATTGGDGYNLSTNAASLVRVARYRDLDPQSSNSWRGGELIRLSKLPYSEQAEVDDDLCYDMGIDD
jgi:hypothetical protein